MVSVSESPSTSQKSPNSTSQELELLSVANTQNTIKRPKLPPPPVRPVAKLRSAKPKCSNARYAGVARSTSGRVTSKALKAASASAESVLVVEGLGGWRVGIGLAWEGWDWEMLQHVSFLFESLK